MLLSKKEILEKIKEGILVLNMIDPAVQVQQAGVDLTIGKIFSLKGIGSLDFTNKKRKIPEYEAVEPASEKWALEPGTYHAAMNETIRLPDNIAGLMVPRSSALACGIEVHSALWDPGYHGRSFIHFSLRRKIELHINARICQMIFFRLESTEEYSGIYKGEDILQRGKRG